MADDTTVTNKRTTFNEDTNDDYVVETVDQGSGVQRQVVEVGGIALTDLRQGLDPVQIDLLQKILATLQLLAAHIEVVTGESLTSEDINIKEF